MSSEVTCRGSFYLGSACGYCKRCQEEMERMKKTQQKTERRTKQVIVMRKDLNMRKGKIAAQAGHAAVGAVLKAQQAGSKALAEWLDSSFRKICVYVNSEQELLEIYQKAAEAKLTTALITDKGDTEFNGVPTKTCCAIGPAFEDEVDPITGKLPLY